MFFSFLFSFFLLILFLSLSHLFPLFLSPLSSSEQNALEAAGNGASQAIKICSNIAANLIAFLAFIRFMDTMFMWFGSNVDLDYISFEWLLSKLFIPISLMMGVEWIDCEKVAKLIGLKTLVNEFVAYKELADMKSANLLTVRTFFPVPFGLHVFSIDTMFQLIQYFIQLIQRFIQLIQCFIQLVQ